MLSCIGQQSEIIGEIILLIFEIRVGIFEFEIFYLKPDWLSRRRRRHRRPPCFQIDLPTQRRSFVTAPSPIPQ